MVGLLFYSVLRRCPAREPPPLWHAPSLLPSRLEPDTGRAGSDTYLFCLRDSIGIIKSNPMPRLLVFLIVCALSFGFLASADERAEKPTSEQRVPVTIDISAQEVYWSREQGKAYARGAVEVKVQRRDAPEQWFMMRADEVVSDLQRGIVHAERGVRLETAQAVLSGRSAHVDTSSEDFWLRGATAVADIPSESHSQLHAYFTGQEISHKADVIYVIRGKITTCDREHPHWSIEAREITLNTRTGRVRLRGGRARVYGLSVPLSGHFTVDIGGKEKSQRLLSSIGYNSHDGLYSPGSITFTGPERSTQLSTAFRISARRGVVGTLQADHDSPRREWYALYERKGDHYYNITEYLELDRAPELGLVQHLIPVGSERSDTELFDLTLSAGYFRERPWGHTPVSVAKLHLGLDREHHKDQREKLIGRWHGWNARWEKYDTGQDFYALQAFAGRGHRFSDRLAASLTVAHNVYGGETPLYVDDVYIRTELQPTLDWDLSDAWRIRASVRWDVQEEATRDYVLQLDRKVHCLTWYVRYRDVGNSVAFGVNLSGITGDTRACPSEREPAWFKSLQPDLAGSATAATTPAPTGLEAAPQDEEPGVEDEKSPAQEEADSTLPADEAQQTQQSADEKQK